MYHPSSSSQRSSIVDEGDWTQSNKTMATDRRQSSYTSHSHSPTFSHFHPPFTAANASYERGSSYPTIHHPPTPAPLPLSSAGQQSPGTRQVHIPSSSTNGFPPVNGSPFQPPEKASSTFYDPTSDHREASPTWTRSDYPNRQSTARRQSHVSESTNSSLYNSKSRTFGNACLFNKKFSLSYL